jgi:hypothetical protein
LRQVFIFVAGGGSFYEYEQLTHKLEQDLAGSVQIVYGSDYIFNPEEFLGELKRAVISRK